jgi:hypothetical protein
MPVNGWLLPKTTLESIPYQSNESMNPIILLHDDELTLERS